MSPVGSRYFQMRMAMGYGFETADVSSVSVPPAAVTAFATALGSARVSMQKALNASNADTGG
jgi:hypothetical protein